MAECHYGSEVAIDTLDTPRFIAPAPPDTFGRRQMIQDDTLEIKSGNTADTLHMQSDDTSSTNDREVGTLQETKSLLIRIIFPSKSGNWPDSCAKFWVPVLYALSVVIMVVQLFTEPQV